MLFDGKTQSYVFQSLEVQKGIQFNCFIEIILIITYVNFLADNVYLHRISLFLFLLHINLYGKSISVAKTLQFGLP